MNATRYEFAVNIYEDQLEEASLCLLHTIIFHRTTGKYVGNDKGFQIGSVGFKDVNCKTIPLTYIMTESQQLHASVQEHVTQFKKQFKHGTRTLNLEFYQKKRGRWFSGDEQIPWEVWSIDFNVVEPVESANPSESIISVMISVAEAVNNQKTFLPKTPQKSDLGLVFDCSYQDVQPYNFRIQIPSQSGFSLKKILRDVSMS